MVMPLIIMTMTKMNMMSLIIFMRLNVRTPEAGYIVLVTAAGVHNLAQPQPLQSQIQRKPSVT